MIVTLEDLKKDFRYIYNKVIETGKYVTDSESTEAQRAEYALYVVLEHILLCLIKQKESAITLIPSKDIDSVMQYARMAKEMLE